MFTDFILTPSFTHYIAEFLLGNISLISRTKTMIWTFNMSKLIWPSSVCNDNSTCRRQPPDSNHKYGLIRYYVNVDINQEHYHRSGTSLQVFHSEFLVFQNAQCLSLNIFASFKFFMTLTQKFWNNFTIWRFIMRALFTYLIVGLNSNTSTEGLHCISLLLLYRRIYFNLKFLNSVNIYINSSIYYILTFASALINALLLSMHLY